MGSIMSPKLGFNPTVASPDTVRGDDKLNQKIARSGVEAARRKFTPEFMNRLDKVVVFRPLGDAELRRILDIELDFVQQRVFHSGNSERSFVFSLTDPAKDHLLAEGTDLKYGARHLKRAIERLLVQPLSNLLATAQIRGGDWLKVDFDSDGKQLVFRREAESLPVDAMAELAGTTSLLKLTQMVQGSWTEPARTQSARTSRRG
jgi:ATP-dependent Clp protease ATP-binding subunit ClpA